MRDKTLCPFCELRPYVFRNLCETCFASMPKETQESMRKEDDLAPLRWHELFFSVIAGGIPPEEVRVSP